MEIRTVKLTEISIDKDTIIRVPSSETEKFEQPIKAYLSFETANGRKEVPIFITALTVMGKGKCRITTVQKP